MPNQVPAGSAAASLLGLPTPLLSRERRPERGQKGGGQMASEGSTLAGSQAAASHRHAGYAVLGCLSALAPEAPSSAE